MPYNRPIAMSDLGTKLLSTNSKLDVKPIKLPVQLSEEEEGKEKAATPSQHCVLTRNDSSSPHLPEVVDIPCETEQHDSEQG